MDIASLQSLISTGEARNVSNSTGVQSGTLAAPAQTSKDVYESKLADIASRYDVRNITPRQVVTMAGELLSNGLISLLESGIMTLHYNTPSFSESNPNEFHPGELDRPDEPRDMLAEFKGMLSLYQATSESAKNVQHVVDDLESIEILHKTSSISKTVATAQSSVNVQAAAKSYTNAISKSTTDPQNVANVLEALASYPKDKSASSNA